VPGIEYHVEPVEGIERGGILHVRGPNRMLGYLRDDAPGVIQEPRSSRGEGWYDTGDVVEIDEDGYLTIVGRVKRFAKVAGEMVSLEVAEAIANTASPHRAHGATLYASERRGEIVVLYTEDRELKRDKLLEAARAQGYPEVAVARVVVAVDKLPRLGSGKCDYVRLKEMAAELGRQDEGAG
jgi:acyl-[acyl-carrier-protein]-phospholipid O-acyltransferase/long-chain-fatty-acid--[acyl-carrier-protein] ligase